MTQTLAGTDLTIGTNGLLSVATGLAAVLLDAERAVLAVRGEMIFAIDQGVPYRQILWDGRRNVAQFQAAIRSRLLTVPDVLEVVALATAQVGDTLVYEATIRTTYGTGQVTNG